jgi:hypothetical protein
MIELADRFGFDQKNFRNLDLMCEWYAKFLRADRRFVERAVASICRVNQGDRF